MEQRAAAQRITTAIARARNAVAALNNDSTNAQVTAADNRIAAVRTAIAQAVDVPQVDKTMFNTQLSGIAADLATAKTNRQRAMEQQRADAQRMAITTTASELETALTALSTTNPTARQVQDVEQAVTQLTTALTNADDVPKAEKDRRQTQITQANNRIAPAKQYLRAPRKIREVHNRRGGCGQRKAAVVL